MGLRVCRAHAAENLRQKPSIECVVGLPPAFPSVPRILQFAYKCAEAFVGLGFGGFQPLMMFWEPWWRPDHHLLQQLSGVSLRVGWELAGSSLGVAWELTGRLLRDLRSVLCFDPSSEALARFERMYSSPSVGQYITVEIFVSMCDEFGGSLMA